MNAQLKEELDGLFQKNASHFNNEGLPVVHKRNTGSTSSGLLAIKNHFEVSLPKEHLDFLEYTNGCTLYNYKDLGGYVFYGIDSLINENLILKETYEELWQKDLIGIGSVLGTGDFLILKILEGDNYQILDGDHDSKPEEWKIIADSFDAFLNKLIEKRGETFWLS